MTFDIKAIIQKRTGENYTLHRDYINPQFAKVLQTIGFDKVYTRAKGPYLYDNEGNEYVDFLSGYGVFALGRNHPKIKKILKEAIDLDTASLIQMEAPLLSGLLAEALVKKINLPGLDTVYLTNSGTESNESAIKFARAATQRNKFVFLDHAFHGLSTGSLAINGNDEFRNGFGELLPGEKVPMNDLNRLEEILKKKDVAAFFFEPIQGKGVFIPDDSYFPTAQKLCRKYGTLFVADEVQAGLGRTGKFLASDHWNLLPDIITVSKALSGGMVPVGAVITRREIYDKVFSRMDRCVVHSSTFGQNNLAMICGLATLEILEEENLIENARIQGTYLLETLRRRLSGNEWVKDIRGKGLMIAVEFGKPLGLKNKVSWNLVHQVDKGLFGELVVMPLLAKHRILTQVSGHHQDILKLLPPYTIEKKHCDLFVSALENVLEDCGKFAGPMWEMGRNMLKKAAENKSAVNG